MHQELDADALTHVRSSIHGLVNPGLAVATLVENGLKNVAVAMCLSLDRRSSLQSLTNQNVPRLLIKDSDRTIVRRLRLLM